MKNNIDFKPVFDYIDNATGHLKDDMDLKFATKTDVERILNAIDKFTKTTKNTE